VEDRKLKILGLSLFGKKGASSRYRLYQYIPLLEAKNIFIDAFPLINDRAYDVFMGIKRINPVAKPFVRFSLVVTALILRFFHILKAGSYDAVYIQKDVLPSFYLFILKLLNKNIIFDLDDALYESHATVKPSIFSLENLFFKMRKHNLNKILKAAKAVTVTVPYLAEYVKRFNNNVHVITGPINCELYKPSAKQSREKVVIGWIGSPVTTKYVQDMMPVFEELQKKYSNVEIRLIGARQFDTRDLDIKFLDWSEETEIDLLSEFDIGIMPLTDDKWSKGKGGLKILQYFAMRIPVVCSPVGINSELITEGSNGYLALSNEEWLEKLGILIESEELRGKLGLSGRNLVEQKFDLKKSVTYIEDIIRKTVLTAETADK
jgi:glycosyltransferase involved in cell wall biosynthesis